MTERTRSRSTHGDHAGDLKIFSNQLTRLSECDLSEAHSPEGRPLGTSQAQEDAFVVKRGAESAVSSVCTIRRCGTRFRSELASICVSEAEAFTYERECSSESFLLVFHAIGFACAFKKKSYNWLSRSAHGDDESFSQAAKHS